MLHRSKIVYPTKAADMFSLISLYFSYRRDVVLAERYVAGLAEKPAQDVVAPQTPAAQTATTAATTENLALAA